jgi:hypothetical protein
MHTYSQAVIDIPITYDPDHKSAVDFRGSEQLLETKGEIDFEFELELS